MSLTWSFSKVIRSKSMKMVFVESITRHKLGIIYAFFTFFVQKSYLNKNYLLFAAINLTTQGPFYTCLFSSETSMLSHNHSILNIKDQDLCFKALSHCSLISITVTVRLIYYKAGFIRCTVSSQNSNRM